MRCETLVCLLVYEEKKRKKRKRKEEVEKGGKNENSEVFKKFLEN